MDCVELSGTIEVVNQFSTSIEKTLDLNATISLVNQFSTDICQVEYTETVFLVDPVGNFLVDPQGDRLLGF